jgi:uncharacterized protein (DUF1800 family)
MSTIPAADSVDVPPREEDGTPPDRRAFFTRVGAAVVGATLLAPAALQGQRLVRPPRFPSTGPLAPVPRLASSTMLKLVNRVTFGATPEEMSRARSMGFLRYLDWQLDHRRIDDSAVDEHVERTWPLLSQNAGTLYTQPVNTLLRQLSEATAYRAVYSQRQLFERMVEFWTDHFTIFLPKVGFLKLLDDRDVIRRHALGKFPEMLWASAHSPAMLAYLDQPQSRGNNPNQNYAREIMELHSLGVSGGYTQDDVAALSRIFTGWTIRNRADFFFDASGHDFTAKVFLGRTFPAQPSSVGAAAVAEGEEAVRMLANHASTARYVGAKLARYLLQYDAPEPVLEAAAAAYTRTGGDIPAMIRAILTPANVAAATAKYKRGFHYVVSTMRATRVAARSMDYVAGRAQTLVGQPLFQHEEPDGYPDSASYWAGSVLPRWNFASYIATGNSNLPVDVVPLMQGTASAVAEAINQQMFCGEMPASLQQALTAYVGTQAQSQARVREACALAMSAAEFMWF